MSRELLIECATCPVRGTHCADCMVTHLRAPTVRRDGPRLEPAERHALELFAAAGLFEAEAIEDAEVELVARMRSVG